MEEVQTLMFKNLPGNLLLPFSSERGPGQRSQKPVQLISDRSQWESRPRGRKSVTFLSITFYLVLHIDNGLYHQKHQAKKKKEEEKPSTKFKLARLDTK